MRCPQATVSGGHSLGSDTAWAGRSHGLCGPQKPSHLQAGVPCVRKPSVVNKVLRLTPEEKVSQRLQFQNGNFKASLTGLRIFFSPSPFQQRIQA